MAGFEDGGCCPCCELMPDWALGVFFGRDASLLPADNKMGAHSYPSAAKTLDTSRRSMLWSPLELTDDAGQLAAHRREPDRFGSSTKQALVTELHESTEALILRVSVRGRCEKPEV